MNKETAEDLFKRTMNIPKEKREEFERCMREQDKKSRHVDKGIETINYMSWKDFDVVAIFAANSPHPLKSVHIGYAYRGDIPCMDDFVQVTSISSDIRKSASKKGIPLKVLSYEEAVKTAKSIDWKKVKIER